MASIHALTTHLPRGRKMPENKRPGDQRIANLRDASPSRAAAQETYYIEDGWVFREHHGKYIECICRTEQIPAVPALKLSVFQHR